MSVYIYIYVGFGSSAPRQRAALPFPSANARPVAAIGKVRASPPWHRAERKKRSKARKRLKAARLAGTTPSWPDILRLTSHHSKPDLRELRTPQMGKQGKWGRDKQQGWNSPADSSWPHWLWLRQAEVPAAMTSRSLRHPALPALRQYGDQRCGQEAAAAVYAGRAGCPGSGWTSEICAEECEQHPPGGAKAPEGAVGALPDQTELKQSFMRERACYKQCQERIDKDISEAKQSQEDAVEELFALLANPAHFMARARAPPVPEDAHLEWSQLLQAAEPDDDMGLSDILESALGSTDLKDKARNQLLTVLEKHRKRTRAATPPRKTRGVPVTTPPTTRMPSKEHAAEGATRAEGLPEAGAVRDPYMMSPSTRTLMQSPDLRPNALQIWIDAAATPDTQAASEGPFQCCYLGRQARGQSSFPCAGEPPHDCGDIIGDQPPQAGLFRCAPAYKSSMKVLHNRSIGPVELHFPRRLFRCVLHNLSDEEGGICLPRVPVSGHQCHSCACPTFPVFPSSSTAVAEGFGKECSLFEMVTSWKPPFSRRATSRDGHLSRTPPRHRGAQPLQLQLAARLPSEGKEEIFDLTAPLSSGTPASTQQLSARRGPRPRSPLTSQHWRSQPVLHRRALEKGPYQALFAAFGNQTHGNPATLWPCQGAPALCNERNALASAPSSGPSSLCPTSPLRRSSSTTTAMPWERPRVESGHPMEPSCKSYVTFKTGSSKRLLPGSAMNMSRPTLVTHSMNSLTPLPSEPPPSEIVRLLLDHDFSCMDCAQHCAAITSYNALPRR